MFTRFKAEDKKRCTVKDKWGNRCDCWAVIEVKGPRHRLCKKHKRAAVRKDRTERAKGGESYIKWLDK